MRRYPLAEDLLRPVLRVAMPRPPRLSAPEGPVHVVARCNNREVYVTTVEDFELRLAHLREMGRTHEVTFYAYTLMSNHVHLLLQAPKLAALGRPLRCFMTETAKAFHRVRGRRGHFWERRYRACLVEEKAYALGASNRLLTWHASYLALSPYPRVRQRQYRALLAPSAEPRTAARDPRWTTQRAVGSPTFVTRDVPRRGRRRIGITPPQNQEVRG